LRTLVAFIIPALSLLSRLYSPIHFLRERADFVYSHRRVDTSRCFACPEVRVTARPLQARLMPESRKLVVDPLIVTRGAMVPTLLANREVNWKR
jgi:hypothetical protein